MSPPQTRSRAKRGKEETQNQEENPVPTKSRCFSNLTNQVPRNIQMTEEKKKGQIIITSSEDTTYDSTGELLQISNPTLKVVLQRVPSDFKIPELKLTSTSKKHKPLEKATAVELKQSTSGAIVTSQVPILKVPTHLKDAESMARTVKRVLEQHMRDASQRLQLDKVPTHLYDLKAYGKFQNQRLQFASSRDQYLAKTYVEEERHYLFTHHVRATICGTKEFPGTKVIFIILEQILKLPHESQTESTIPKAQTLSDLHSLFTDIIGIFPVEPFRSHFTELFQMPFIVSETPAKKKVQQGVFQVVLESLSDLIHYKDEVKVRSKTTDVNKITNFYYWDAQCQEEASFAYFPRNEKFSRLFMILDLLTRALESDLAMFAIKYSNSLHSSINSQSGPLIRHLIWKEEDVAGVNFAVKNVISDFIKMIGLNYPKTKIRIMSRVLNLIVQTVNLCDYTEGRSEYPKYGQSTIELVHEINKTLENSVYYSLGFVINVAESIQSHLIRMLLIKKTLESIHKTTYKISLEVPFKLIRGKEFTKFKDDVANAARNEQETYPIYNGTTKSECFTVTQNKYLKLVAMFAESFDELYHISKGLKLVPQEEKIKDTKTEPVTLNTSKLSKMLEGVDLNEKVVLRGVDLKYKPHSSLELSFSTLNFYRSEFKNMLALEELIKQCRTRCPGKFNEWDRFMKAFEVKD